MAANEGTVESTLPRRAVVSQRALKSAAVYAVANALQRALLFALLPLYTRAMPPAEYGALSVLMAISTGFAILFAFGLDLSIFRTYFELEDQPDHHQRFIDSIWRFLTYVPVATSLVLGGLAWLLIGDIGYVHGYDILLALVSAGVLVAATTVPLGLLRAQQRLPQYIAVTAAGAVGTGGLTALFVVALHLGVAGWFMGTTLANGIAFGVAATVIPWRRRASFDRVTVRKSVLFGLPLIPHFLSHWALNLADRLVLAGIVAGGALGVYSLAANLAVPAMVVVQSVNHAFMPTYARAGVASDGLGDELRSVVGLQVAIVATTCVSVALVAPPFIHAVAPTSYGEAASLVGWLVLGYAFLGLYYIPMNGATLGAGRNRWAWVVTVFSAATNLGLIGGFAPSHGVRAAAIASAVGYLVLLIGIGIYAHGRGNPVRYPWATLIQIALIVCGSYGLAMGATHDSQLSDLVIRGVWSLITAGMLLFVGLGRPNLRNVQAYSATKRLALGSMKFRR